MSKSWHINFHLLEVTPGEVERVSGLSTGLQRDWRHRGFLPKSDKHARFDAFALAEAMVMKSFADRGIGPQQSVAIAPKVGTAIVLYALAYRSGAWKTPAEVLFDSLPGVQIDVKRYDSNGSGLTRIGKATYLADLLSNALKLHGPDHFNQFIWWPTGESEFGHYGSMIEAYSVSEGETDGVDARFDGPAHVLDIGGMAANMMRRLQQPLIDGKVEITSASERFRHVTITRGK